MKRNAFRGLMPTKSTMRRLALGTTALALVALEVGPTMAAYSPTQLIGPFSGDATTPSAGSTVLTVSKFNGGTSFPATNPIASQQSSAVAITGGTINGTAIGGSNPAAVTGTAITGTSVSAGTGAVSGGPGTFSGIVTSAGEVGATQTVTGTSGTIASTTGGATASFIYVNNASAAVALAGPTNLVPGSHFIIKDGGGAAGTNNITYTPGSGITIDGASTYVLNQNRQAINVWVVSATVQAIY